MDWTPASPSGTDKILCGTASVTFPFIYIQEDIVEIWRFCACRCNLQFPVLGRHERRPVRPSQGCACCKLRHPQTSASLFFFKPSLPSPLFSNQSAQSSVYRLTGYFFFSDRLVLTLQTIVLHGSCFNRPSRLCLWCLKALSYRPLCDWLISNLQ